jgi:hypothetical protein
MPTSDFHVDIFLPARVYELCAIEVATRTVHLVVVNRHPTKEGSRNKPTERADGRTTTQEK